MPTAPPFFERSTYLSRQYPESLVAASPDSRALSSRHKKRKSPFRELARRRVKATLSHGKMLPVNRFSASAQFTTLHHAVMYSGRRFWYFK